MMKCCQESHGLYERKDGAKLACLIRRSGDRFKSVMVDCRGKEYVEDPIRLAHWPQGSGVEYHKTFAKALAYVEEHAGRWKRARQRPKRGRGTPFSCGI